MCFDPHLAVRASTDVYGAATLLAGASLLWTEALDYFQWQKVTWKAAGVWWHRTGTQSPQSDSNWQVGNYENGSLVHAKVTFFSACKTGLPGFPDVFA